MKISSLWSPFMRTSKEPLMRYSKNYMSNSFVNVRCNMKKAKRQIKQLASDFRRLSDKKPNDTLNTFKLELVNSAIAEINSLLQGELPISGFEQFDEAELPNNSDVLLVLSLYEAELNSNEYDNLS